MNPGKESGSRDRACARNGADVRQVAYAEYTPPKCAERPTLRSMHTNTIPYVDARIISFEGAMKN